MKPKVGIALSSGAVRGISHIGILKVLEKEGVPIDIIGGTSIGALVGALYSSGMKVGEIEGLVKTAKWKELIDFTPPKAGLIAGKKIEAYLKSILDSKNFEDLKIPLSVIATELNTGERMVFNKGNLVRSVRASISMPGIFEPVAEDDLIFVDGGLVDPVPADIVKSMGADITVAVDLTINFNSINMPSLDKEESDFTEFLEKEFVSTEISYLKDFLRNEKIKLPFFINRFLNSKRVIKMITNKETPPILKYAVRSLDIIANQLAKEKLKYPYVDVIIKPEFVDVKWTEFDKTEYCIKAGEIAAQEAVPKIKKL